MLCFRKEKKISGRMCSGKAQRRCDDVYFRSDDHVSDKAPTRTTSVVAMAAHIGAGNGIGDDDGPTMAPSNRGCKKRS